MRSSLGGTRASREGEPYPQDANVTDAAMVRLTCRTEETLQRMDTPNCERREVMAHVTRRITMAKGCGSEGGENTKYPPPRTWSGKYRKAGTSMPLHATRIAPNLVRQVKGSKRHLRPHKTYDTSNAGTCTSSRKGREADTQCWYRGREVVVPGGVTPTQGYG
jgi:hypothetical protein